MFFGPIKSPIFVLNWEKKTRESATAFNSDKAIAYELNTKHEMNSSPRRKMPLTEKKVPI